jgi:hypothetical protein
MYKINNANFIRVGNHNGQTAAEVEMNLSGYEKPFTVYLQKTNEGISITQILQSDADYAIDWYENNLHQAYIDQTSNLLLDSEESLTQQLLNYGNISEEIERNL